MPRFSSRAKALKFLSWYYLQPHWREFRPKCYDYWGGICQHCGKPCDRRFGWQIHHETLAYAFLWHEQDRIYLCKLVHTECHRHIERQKQRERKRVVPVSAKQGRNKTTSFSKKVARAAATVMADLF